MKTQQRKEYEKQWRLKNKDRVLIQRKKWMKKNKKKILEYHKIYQKKWRQLNKQKTVEIRKRSYYKNHKKRLADRRKQYRKNKTRENKYRVKLAMDKYHSNPIDWIKMNLRSRLLRVLNTGTKKLRKISRSLQLFGADIPVIKNYIEKQFKTGMNWDNRGKWHIDHKKPISSFDLSNPKEQEKAFHYTNLQPLWAIENLKKGSKYKKGRLLKRITFT